jgi:hypothetical protein
MDNPAERDLFTRWRWRILVGIIVLLAVQTYLMGPAHGRRLSWALAADVLAAVVPNFLAGLIGALVVYLVVKDSDRSNYVRAMRVLRGATLSLMNTEKIKAAGVRSLMKVFVPAVSQLYFKSEQPPVRQADQSLSFRKKQCFSCRESSEVRAGRCTICHDILDSWREEERATT